MFASNLTKLLNEKASSEALYGLEHICPVRTWDYSSPTLTVPRQFLSRTTWTESALYADHFMKLYPVFKHINLNNLAMAGGAVLDLLTNKTPTTDLDFFVISDESSCHDSKEQFARRRVERFIDDLYAYMDNSNKELLKLEEDTKKTKPSFRLQSDQLYDLQNGFSVKRVLNVWTIQIPKISVPIQVVETSYDSLSKLFQQVDIDCTAVAFYEGSVQFSELGKFCFENLCFIVDGSNRSCRYPDRIIKYFNRGFDVIMPSLDVSQVPTRLFKFDQREVIDMPFLNIVVSGINKNKVFVANMDKVDTHDDDYGSDTLDNYQQANSAKTINAGENIHHNILCLIRDDKTSMIVDGYGSQYKNAYRSLPLITDRMIINSYETVKPTLFANGSINFVKLEKYFTFISIEEILKRLLHSYVATQTLTDVESSESVKKHRVIFGKSFNVHVEKVIDELVDSQVASAIEKLAAQHLEETTASSTAASADATADIGSSLVAVELSRVIVQDVSSWFGRFYKTAP